jgi:hypothetical protein
VNLDIKPYRDEHDVLLLQAMQIALAHQRASGKINDAKRQAFVPA